MKNRRLFGSWLWGLGSLSAWHWHLAGASCCGRAWWVCSGQAPPGLTPGHLPEAHPTCHRHTSGDSVFTTWALGVTLKPHSNF